MRIDSISIAKKYHLKQGIFQLSDCQRKQCLLLGLAKGEVKSVFYALLIYIYIAISHRRRNWHYVLLKFFLMCTYFNQQNFQYFS